MKLLAPNSQAHKRYSPDVDGVERSMLSQSPPVLEYLQMGGIELSETTGVTLTPALYIANATESLEIPPSSSLNQILGIETPFVGESYPVVLRLITHQPSEPPYEKSNPVMIARVREQLDFFLDGIHFRGLSADRIGYQFPSVALTAGITASYNLEAIATPWEVYDFRLEVIFKRQKEMYYD